MNVRDLVPWSRGDRERSPSTRSEPMSPVVSLHREMNRLFDDVFRGFEDPRFPQWCSDRNGSEVGAGRRTDQADSHQCGGQGTLRPKGLRGNAPQTLEYMNC
jgi:hypothetical protein